MGNQPSSSDNCNISNFSFDALILESVLNEVPADSVQLTVQKIKNIKTASLPLISDKIFEKAITNHYCSDKYAQLAKKLCEEAAPQEGFVASDGTGVDWNLQDYINRKAHHYYEILHSCIENGRPLTNDRLYGISVFIGNLYNHDLVTAEKIYLWILNEAYPLATEVRRHILFTIKDKVSKLTENQNETCSDPFVWEIVDWLGKEGIIRNRITIAKPMPKILPAPARTTMVFTNSSASSSSTTNVTPAPQNKVKINIPEAFEKHLKSLKSLPVIAFDIQLLKTCNEADRRESANRMLKYALLDSREAQKYAKLALSILQLQMKTSATKKSFVNYLSDACEKQLEKYKDTSRLNWVEMENFGIFLAELYNLEVLRIFITNTWLENTRKMAEENDLALKMLMNVMKIVYPKMKVKDAKTLGMFLKHFERYKNACRMPVAYISWYNTAVNASKVRDRSSSAVSSASGSSQSSSTGAIKKQGQVIVENAETTKICNEFTQYLVQLKTKGSGEFTINLNTASDAAIRGCVLLLIEHSLSDDSKIGFFVHVTKFIIMKHFTKDDRFKVFSANFSLYIYSEMNKCLKTEDPKLSNWKQVETLGKYISELYNKEVIEGTIVKAWLSKLEFTATIGSEEAGKEFFVTFSKVGVQLKKEFPEEYEEFQKFSNREKPKEPVKKAAAPSKVAFPTIMSNEMRDFNYILCNLNTSTPKKLDSAIEKLNVNDRDNMETLVQIFFDAYKKHNGNPVYAQLAKSMNEKFKLSTCSFKNLLIAMVIGEFNKISDNCMTNAEKTNALSHAKCIGELYNIGWLDESILVACLDKLCGDNFNSIHNVQTFRNFVNNIALDMAKYGHGECCQKYYKILKQKNFIDAFNQFVCEETLKILESIWKLTKMRKSHNIDELFFLEILRKLTMENIALLSSRINLSTVGCDTDLKEIVNALLQTCYQNPDNTSMYVKFLSEIKELKVEAINGDVTCICEEFIVRCKTEFKSYSQSFDLKELPNIMTILSIQSELYNTSLSGIEDVTFYLDIFFAKAVFSDNKIECLDFFLRKIGSKADEDDKEILDLYFNKLSMITNPTEYISQHVKVLCDLREKRWMNDQEFIDFTSIDMQKIEEFLASLKDEDIASKFNIPRAHILKSEENVNDFIHVLFKCNLENENIHVKSAYCCKLLNTGEPNEIKQKFVENINQFMRCRAITFSAVAKEDVNEKLRAKLVNVMLLNAQLYSVNIIDNQTIQSWLIPSLTSHLNLSQISTLCMLVSPKIDESDSIQLKARLMNLESAMQEKQLQLFSSTKDELASLKV